MSPKLAFSTLDALFLTVTLLASCLVQGEISPHSSPGHTARRQAIQVEAGSEGEEGWSYPLTAFRDPVKKFIRIYGSYSVQVIGNDTNRGEHTQFAGCLMKGSGKEELVHNVNPIYPLMQWDDEFTAKVRHTANYIIDCYDPGNWATHTVVRIQNGDDLGIDLEIIDIPGERLGRLSVCSQPLSTNREWLRDWVDHQFAIGADKVFMHVPKGHAVDELFSDKRTDRLQYNSQLAERSPGVTGKEPLKKFVRKNTEWFDYWPGPTAQYYSEELIFSSCHYRNRYAYDYSIQFDIDEFWTPANSTVEQLLPDFLDKHMEEQTAEILFTQLLFPLDCATRTSGPYTSRFTLQEGGDGQSKPAVRPGSILRMHVHFIMDTSDEYKAKTGRSGWKSWKSQEVSTDVAFLKHIRPMTHIDETNKTVLFPCHFGNQSDPKGEHLRVTL